MTAGSLDGAAERGALDRWNNEGGAPACDARHGRRGTGETTAAAGALLVGPASHPHASGDPVAGIGRLSVVGRGPMDDQGAPPST